MEDTLKKVKKWKTTFKKMKMEDDLKKILKNRPKKKLQNDPNKTLEDNLQKTT